MLLVSYACLGISSGFKWSDILQTKTRNDTKRITSFNCSFYTISVNFSKILKRFSMIVDPVIKCLPPIQAKSIFGTKKLVEFLKKRVDLRSNMSARNSHHKGEISWNGKIHLIFFSLFGQWRQGVKNKNFWPPPPTASIIIIIRNNVPTVSIMFQQCVLSSIYKQLNPMKHTVNLQTWHLACPSYKLEMIPVIVYRG